MADIKQYVKAAEEKMTFAIEYLDEQLSHIRAGKANPKILDCVRVMYYGCLLYTSDAADECGYRNCSGCENDHDYSLGEEDYQGY